MAKRAGLDLEAPDGHVLAAHWFTPDPAADTPRAAVVVVPGGGVSARVYARLAAALADRGFAVLTFDCRGIGASRRGSLRGLDAGVEHWGGLDTEAALLAAAGAYPDAPVFAVAHSIGCLYLGAAPAARRLARIVFVAPHTGYWRDYAPAHRRLLFALFHVLMPAVTRICGYFPARRLGLGNDLPARFALQWAGRRQPELLVTDADVARFGATLSAYSLVKARTLALAMCDDPFASPAAAVRLCGLYPGLAVCHQTVTRSEAGMPQVGHFAFQRDAGANYFADRISAWFLQNPNESGRTPTSG
jgi:predicted alpha/beta hydrolase